jgi:hypothetical protein
LGTLLLLYLDSARRLHEEMFPVFGRSVTTLNVGS